MRPCIIKSIFYFYFPAAFISASGSLPPGAPSFLTSKSCSFFHRCVIQARLAAARRAVFPYIKISFYFSPLLVFATGSLPPGAAQMLAQRRQKRQQDKQQQEAGDGASGGGGGENDDEADVDAFAWRPGGEASGPLNLFTCMFFILRCGRRRRVCVAAGRRGEASLDPCILCLYIFSAADVDAFFGRVALQEGPCKRGLQERL